MSWYISQDGEQLWVARDETVFTLVESSEKTLPLENLTYLTTSTRRAVFHEALCDEETWRHGKASRIPRRRKGENGKQRGFIIRCEVEESPLQRVIPTFKGAAQKLVDDNEVCRVDADEAVNIKRQKKNKDKLVNLNLGCNECRIETTARINHFAHGPGYRVEVSQGSVTQKIHFFTHRRVIPFREWTEMLMEAIEHSGNHVMLAQRQEADKMEDPHQSPREKDTEKLLSVRKQTRDKAKQDDEAWLQRMMNMAAEDEDDDESDSDSDSQSAAPALQERASSVPPKPSPAVSSTPPAARRQAQEAPAAGLPPPGSSRSSRDQSFREWHQARDTPRHMGYTTDWGHSNQDSWQDKDWSSWRRKGNGYQRWTEHPQRQKQAQGNSWRSQDSRQRPEQQAERQGRPAVRSQHGIQRGGQNPAAQQRPLLRQPQNPPQHPAPQPLPQQTFQWDVKEEVRPDNREEGEQAICFECGRGKPLKLFTDEDDGNKYCFKCWVDFYGQNPPHK